MWGMSSCDYELWRERDYEILIMQPILENVPQFQIFTVLIMIVSTEGRRMTGNHTDSLHCTKPDTKICFLQLNNWGALCCLFDICFIHAQEPASLQMDPFSLNVLALFCDAVWSCKNTWMMIINSAAISLELLLFPDSSFFILNLKMLRIYLSNITL